jgi:hypothetical protein
MIYQMYQMTNCADDQRSWPRECRRHFSWLDERIEEDESLTKRRSGKEFGPYKNHDNGTSSCSFFIHSFVLSFLHSYIVLFAHLGEPE